MTSAAAKPEGSPEYLDELTSGMSPIVAHDLNPLRTPESFQPKEKGGMGGTHSTLLLQITDRRSGSVLGDLVQRRHAVPGEHYVLHVFGPATCNGLVPQWDNWQIA